MEEDILYKELILDLYKNPLNKRLMSGYNAYATESNPTCGDVIHLFLKYENGKAIDASHQGQGCAISQAAVSLLTEDIKGKTKEYIAKLTEKDMIELLGIEISSNRIKCATLGLKALQKSLE